MKFIGVSRVRLPKSEFRDNLSSLFRTMKYLPNALQFYEISPLSLFLSLSFSLSLSLTRTHTLSLILAWRSLRQHCDGATIEQRNQIREKIGWGEMESRRRRRRTKKRKIFCLVKTCLKITPLVAFSWLKCDKSFTLSKTLGKKYFSRRDHLAQWIAYLLPTQQPWVQLLAIP